MSEHEHSETGQGGEVLDEQFLHGKALSYWQKVSYSMGEVGVSLAPTVIVSWLIYYYTKATTTSFLPNPYLTIAFIGVFGRLIDAVADPLVGYYSDKVHTRMGRRIPWVLFGTPFFCLTFAATWFPPVAETSWLNFAWLLVMLGGFWFFYTAVVAPYLSLLPEITPYNDERISVSMYMGYGDILGLILAQIVAMLVLETYKGGVDLGPVSLRDGYQLMAIILAVGTGMFFFLSIGWVREKPFSAEKAVPFKFVDATKECLRNTSFIPYVISMSFFRIALDVVVAAVPFIVDSLMYRGESIAALLQIIIVVVSAFLFPLVLGLSVRKGKKAVFRYGLLVFALGLPFIILTYWIPGLLGFSEDIDPVLVGNIRLGIVIAVFLVCTFSIACSFVLQRAIVADIIDIDAKKTGYRREAMYNGMEGLITKFAAAVATGMVPLFLYLFGDGDRVGFLGKFYGMGPRWGVLLMGPASGFLLYLAYVYFKRYPIER